MEFVLIHKPVGTIPPEVMKLTLEMVKKLVAKPEEFVPNGKRIASYYAIAEQAAYCIWDVPNFEALEPFLRQMTLVGWNTEVIPAQKVEVAIANLEKAMQAMQAQMAGG